MPLYCAAMHQITTQGDGTTVDRLLPKQVGTGYSAIVAGADHTVALKSDGSLWTWGSNFYGQLGDGSVIGRTTPSMLARFVLATGQTIGPITFSPATLAVGGTSTASAIASSGLAVTYSVTTLSICTVNPATGIIKAIAVGTCTVAANQPGASIYNAAPQVTQSIAVAKSNQIVSFGSAPIIGLGGTYAISATSTSGLVVSLTSATPTICSVAGSAVTGIALGTCTLAGNQAGDVSYNPAIQATQSIVISKIAQSIGTIGFLPSTLATGGTTVASATSSSALPVIFTTTTPEICTVSGSTVTGITAGNCIVAANQGGDANYNAATQTTQLVSISKSFNLSPSWNLLGNGVNAPIAVATSFGNASNVATVWKWVPATSRWAFYTPTLADGGAANAVSKGYDFLTVINGGEGFWVNAKAAFTAPLPAGAAILSGSFQVQSNPALNKLLTGWNLIGTGDNLTPSAFNQSLSVTPPAIGTIPANVTTLWGWDSTLVNWYFYAPTLDSAGTLASYITSKNYLNFGTKVLDPATGFWVNIPGVVATGGGVPTVTGITPTTGAAGATVTITGTNFNSTPANNTVKFGGVLATVTAATSTALTVTVPAGTTTGSVTVATTGGTATSASSFTTSTGGGGGVPIQPPSTTGATYTNTLTFTSPLLSIVDQFQPTFVATTAVKLYSFPLFNVNNGPSIGSVPASNSVNFMWIEGLYGPEPFNAASGAYGSLSVTLYTNRDPQGPVVYSPTLTISFGGIKTVVGNALNRFFYDIGNAGVHAFNGTTATTGVSNCLIGGANASFLPTCSSLGILFDRGAGTVSFSNTSLYERVGGANILVNTVTGSLNFTPY